MDYIANTERETEEMLAAIGVATIDDLFQDIPADLQRPRLNIPRGRSELEVWRHLQALARRNRNLEDFACFLGAGAYRHFIPSVVGHLISRGEFLTSYTPYQPEVSQGTLQSIYEFQSLVCELTGMDVANAGVYDAATALGEAARMACAVNRRARIVVADTVNPLYRAVLRTYAPSPGYRVVTVPVWGPDAGASLARVADLADAVDDTTACLIVQQPNFLGWLEDLDGLAQAVHARGALLVVAVDPLTLGLLRPPGEYGADIVVGEGKWLGWPPDFGGPNVGLFATRDRYVRQMPGRLVGATLDQDGRRAFVLTLVAREQHIRREKATSNICTSEALVALGTAIYLCHMGMQGLREAATLCLQKSHYAAGVLDALPGYAVVSAAPYVKEFVLRCPRPVRAINSALLDAGIVGGFDLARFDPRLANHMLLCVTEMNTRDEIDRLAAALQAFGTSILDVGLQS